MNATKPPLIPVYGQPAVTVNGNLVTVDVAAKRPR